MNIRSVTHDDLNNLVLIFEEYRAFYKCNSDLISAYKFISERIENKDAEIFVAEADNQLVGFIQLYPLFSSTRMKKLWLLNDLFVQPFYRGRGISKELITKAKQLANETNSAGLILETVKTNEIANQLYKREGFELDLEHNYYAWS